MSCSERDAIRMERAADRRYWAAPASESYAAMQALRKATERSRAVQAAKQRKREAREFERQQVATAALTASASRKYAAYLAELPGNAEMLAQLEARISGRIESEAPP